MGGIPRNYATDWGSDGGPDKGKFKTKGGPAGVCPECKTSRPVTKGAWFRRNKPTCARCGSYLVPSKNAQKKFTVLDTSSRAPKERRCERCGAKLRITNTEKLCSPCYSTFSKSETWVAHSATSKGFALRRFLRNQ